MAKKPPKKTPDFSKRMVTLIMVWLVIFSFLAAFSYLSDRAKQAIPMELILCVFGFAGGECGLMAWIKTTKVRNDADSEEATPASPVNLPELLRTVAEMLRPGEAKTTEALRGGPEHGVRNAWIPGETPEASEEDKP
ncbi:MAG: hypothetical protein LBJ11_07770 [Oscillospiraceae bacterium]|jgi:hypothetical protein|nr:hypothetical protein [Oscillospiraceae bacterium]